MVSLTKHFETTKHQLDAGEVQGDKRPYLGMSGLGNECSRQIWYAFRWAYDDTFPHRMRRLFARGHREEPEIIKELERIGIRVLSTQDEYVDETGHIKGHSDGTCIGVIEAPKTEHLTEFKTMADKYFKTLVKSGSVEKEKPTYFAQMQLYMHFGKLKRALFIAVNKNDDSYYVERVPYDKAKALALLQKGHMILMSSEPPGREFPSKTFFKCKWCTAKDMCWDNKPVNKNCRTCIHVELCNEGKWSCTEAPYGNRIPVEVQLIGCKQYRGIQNVEA